MPGIGKPIRVYTYTLTKKLHHNNFVVRHTHAAHIFSVSIHLHRSSTVLYKNFKIFLKLFFKLLLYRF